MKPPLTHCLPSHPPAQSIQDAQNYAFYLPPTSSNQKGTFLDEQLTFEDYTLIGHVPILEVSHTAMAGPAGLHLRRQHVLPVPLV